MKLAVCAVVVALAAGAAGCDTSSAEARYVARQAAVDPPQLWLAEALGPQDQAVDAVYVCTDQGLREGLARAAVSVNGAPCLPYRDAVDRPELFAVRCEASGQRLSLTVNREGDQTRDFTVRVMVKRLDGSGQGGGHVRRYRHVGSCPAGWAVGDQAKPGKPPSSNALGLVGRYVDLGGRPG